MEADIADYLYVVYISQFNIKLIVLQCLFAKILINNLNLHFTFVFFKI